MAQIARDRQLHDWIDDYLSYLVDVWAGLPGLADEWDRWDESSRLTFVVDWGCRATACTNSSSRPSRDSCPRRSAPGMSSCCG